MLKDDIESLDDVMSGHNKFAEDFDAAWNRIKKALAELSKASTNTIKAEISSLEKVGCYNEESFEYGWNKAIEAALQKLSAVD